MNCTTCSEYIFQGEHEAPEEILPDFPETELPLKRRSKHRRVGENSTAASDENATQQSPSKSTELTCGKCTSTLFNSVEEFELHAAKEHGGLARPKGQPQDFTGLTTTHFFSVGLFSVKVCLPGKLVTPHLGNTDLCCSSLYFLISASDALRAFLS